LYVFTALFEIIPEVSGLVSVSGTLLVFKFTREKTESGQEVAEMPRSQPIFLRILAEKKV